MGFCTNEAGAQGQNSDVLSAVSIAGGLRPVIAHSRAARAGCGALPSHFVPRRSDHVAGE